MKTKNALCGLISGLLVQTARTANAQYTAYDLGTLGGTFSVANGINSSGTVVGEAFTSGDATSHAFRYSGGVMTDLGTLGGSYSSASGINDSGTVVGFANTSGEAEQHAFRYSGGVMTDLKPYLTSIGMKGISSARAIDDNGDIVGVGDLANGATHAFLLLKVIPEPSTVALAGLSGLYLLLFRRRK